MAALQYDIVVIGGGPAGLGAAVAAKRAGCNSILILERDSEPGGILNQCIHNGFGLHTFREELTGPEYAARYIKQVEELAIPMKLNTMVVDISEEKLITAMSRQEGLFTLQAGAVILAMDCRERSRGALNIPGYRPAGIYSAGTAQRYVNMEGMMPGREVVILGSGDIGLIMARRMTLEGAKVKVVAELMPYSGGLKRNIVQCLDDYGIPLKLNTTVVDIKGRNRVEAVVLAKVDENRRPIPGTEETIRCDTLLLSCGLIPENELTLKLTGELSPITGGPIVDNFYETCKEGVFACGNVLHVHDLVDYVSEEAELAGEYAAAYVSKASDQAAARQAVVIRCGHGVRYTVPAILRGVQTEKKTAVKFRVDQTYKDIFLSVYLDEERVLHQKKRIMAPGEMEVIQVRSEWFGQSKYRELKIVLEET